VAAETETEGTQREKPADDSVETVRPTAGEPDGPKQDDWASPPITQEESSGVHDGTSHRVPGVDPEVSSMVDVAIENAVKRPSTSPETSATEIDIDELGLDGTEEEGGEVLQSQSAPHISDDEFDQAPRAPGVVTVPPPPGEKQSGSSLLAISTLIKLGEMLGHDPSEETKSLDTNQATALKTVLSGKWPDNEELTRRIIIIVLKEALPGYTKSKRWQNMPFKDLKKLFLDELTKSEIQPLVELAILLRSAPPPMPRVPRPGW